jgi:tetratricopeptide (TPR) repeat protein/class 3 adenylate cyclase
VNREGPRDVLARLLADRGGLGDGSSSEAQERWALVERVFIAALEAEEAGDERDAVLARECADNPEIQAEVASLLEAHAAKGAADQLEREFADVRNDGLSVGDRVGRYEILEQLGAGGMGTVYTASDTRLGRTVALKLLSRFMSVDPGATQRFLLEAKSAAALDHQNICAIHEVGETDDGQLFIVMAFYEGETLAARISRGSLPVAEALRIAVDVARGLEHAHARGIVHRDIKPANLVLTDEGPVKILDFGIAKVEDVSLTGSGMIVGTIPYMSPEHASGRAIDHRTDLWSLGVVLYEMIAGRPPFAGPTAEATIAAIVGADPTPLTGPPGAGAASRVLHRLLAKDAAQRFPNATATITALGHALDAVSGGTPWDGADGAAPIAPEGERRQVAVLVTHVGGYSELLERLAPEEWERAIGRIRQAATEVALRHGGMVHRLEGETFVCLFGVPTTHEDDIHHSVRAARELHASCTDTRAVAEDVPPIRLCSGISAGVVVVQPDPARRAYRVAGDPLEIAYRLAGHATHDEILVGPECERQLLQFYEMRPGAPVALPERTGEVIPHAVVAELTPDTQLDTADLLRLTRFAGRRRELGVVRGAIERAVAGEGAFVTVQGEAGAGKSRLLYELDRSLPSDDILLVHARCRALGSSGTPYVPFIAVIRKVLDLGTGPAQSLDPELIASRLRDTAPDLAESLPLFLHLLGVPRERFPLPLHIEGEQLRTAIRDSVAALCTETARARPMLLQFEDWHWADRASHEVLLQIAELAPTFRLAVVVTYRPGHGVTWDDTVPRATVQLGPLNAESGTELIGAVLGARSVARQVALAIHERAGGNPFFLEELCHTLEEQGALTMREGEVTLAEALADLHLPVTIQGVIRSRLDRLDPETREVVRIASAAGHEFTLGLLRSLVKDESRLGPALQRLKEMGLVQQTRLLPEPSYRFKHILTQEVAYDTLLAHRRRELHGRVGEAIESLQVERLDELADELAYHFSRARRWDKAVRHGLRAARQAQALSEFSRALSVLDQVEEWTLKLQDEQEQRDSLVEVLLQQERLCETLGSKKRQQEILDRLLGMLEPGGDRAKLAEVYIRQGEYHTLVKRFGDAEPVLQRALALYRDLCSEVGERNALTSLGLLFWHQGRNQEGITSIEQALAIDRARGRHLEIVRDLGNLATILKGMGEWQRALAALEEARPLAERTDDPISQSFVLYNMGLVYRAMGDPDRALEYLYQCEELNRKTPAMAINTPFFYTGVARVLLEKGDVDQAVAMYREAVEHARRVGNAEGLPRVLRILGDVLVGLGRGPQALPCLREAAQLYAQLENPSEEGELWAKIGTAEAGLKNHGAAADAWDRARARRRERGDVTGELEAAEHRARGLREAGEDVQLTRAAFHDALDLAAQLEDRVKEGELLNALGILEWRVREYGEALDCYERAYALFKTLGDRARAGLALNSIGATLLCLNRVEDATQRLEEAVRLNREGGQELLEGHALGVLGDAYLAAGAMGSAVRSYEASLAIRRRIGDRRGEGWMLYNLARAADISGENAAAGAFREDARRVGVELGDNELLRACESPHSTPADRPYSEEAEEQDA